VIHAHASVLPRHGRAKLSPAPLSITRNDYAREMPQSAAAERMRAASGVASFGV